MVRKKVHTKEILLEHAVKYVQKYGFSHFTARNLADSMCISTQPIYLEFKNMDDLREQVLQRFFKMLFDDVLLKEVTGNPLVDVGLNFIEFANNNKVLFQALYIEENGGGHKMYEQSSKNYHELIKGLPEYQHLDDYMIENLHVRSWIVVMGLAVLTTSQIFKPTQEQLVQTIEDGILLILNNKNPVLIQ